jgi:hypothetical protein
MRRQRKILFETFFLLAVLFCCEMNGYAKCSVQFVSIEYVTGTDSVEKVFISDIDSFDDEQVNQFFEYSAIVDLVYPISFPQNCILIPIYPTSIWQPPKKLNN